MIPFFSQEQVFNPVYQGIFLSFLKEMGFSLSRLRSTRHIRGLPQTTKCLTAPYPVMFSELDDPLQYVHRKCSLINKLGHISANQDQVQLCPLTCSICEEPWSRADQRQALHVEAKQDSWFFSSCQFHHACLNNQHWLQYWRKHLNRMYQNRKVCTIC